MINDNAWYEPFFLKITNNKETSKTTTRRSWRCCFSKWIGTIFYNNKELYEKKWLFKTPATIFRLVGTKSKPHSSWSSKHNKHHTTTITLRPSRSHINRPFRASLSRMLPNKRIFLRSSFTDKHRPKNHNKLFSTKWARKMQIKRRVFLISSQINCAHYNKTEFVVACFYFQYWRIVFAKKRTETTNEEQKKVTVFHRTHTHRNAHEGARYKATDGGLFFLFVAACFALAQRNIGLSIQSYVYKAMNVCTHCKQLKSHRKRHRNKAMAKP